MGLIRGSARRYYEGKDGVQGSGDESYGNYQFTSLEDVINQFIIAYVGEDKIINKIRKADVSFHAQRALQELSFDTFKSCKSLELEVPNSLQLPLPQDYVNYVKLSWVDGAGVKRVLQPASKTSNPLAYQQNADGSLKFESNTYQQTVGAPFEEYGITSTGKTSSATGGGLIKANKPLLQYESELRVPFDTSGTSNLKYATQAASPAGNPNDRVKHGMWIQLAQKHDLSVGMSVVGPGLPSGMTINAIDTVTGSVAYPYNIELAHVDYEDWVLSGVGGTNPVEPSIIASQTLYDNEELIFANLNKKSDTSTKYKSSANKETTLNSHDYDTDMYDLNRGQRYGLEPQHAQTNGSYYIDCDSGLVNFSSNISGKTVIIEYISDSLGTNAEMKVHKFAEEAMYKCIAYAIMSTRANVQEYIVQRFKRERFAETRKAKLRLSNLKIEELTQILRGRSKIIKH
tara:strand:+ start:875 stop:2248 length:1374 start_codon:yes stop_codon:yes gene_type:complete